MSLSHSQLETIRRLAEDIAVREGCKLYDVEFTGGPHRTLRVFIEKESGGASLEDCVNVSRGLNLILDVEDTVPGGHYDLEVSTPGLERKLTQLWHFEKAKGERLQVRYASEDATQTIDAKVLDVVGQNIIFETKSGSLEVPFSNIQKAKQVFSGPEKGKKR